MDIPISEILEFIVRLKVKSLSRIKAVCALSSHFKRLNGLYEDGRPIYYSEWHLVN